VASLRRRQRSDGSVNYEVRSVDPKTHKQVSVPFDSETEARKYMTVLEAHKGNIRQSLVTISASRRSVPLVVDVLAEHIDLLTGVSPGQLTRYRHQVRDHMSGPLGATPIDTVDIRHVTRWIQGLESQGLSAKTIKNLHGLFSSAMKTAVRLGYRSSNPCVGVSLPKSTATEDAMCVLTHGEFRILLNSMAPRYKSFIKFLVGTGLRWSEATALQVADVDFNAQTPTVRVTKAWKRGGDGKDYLGAPKTQRSRRTVSLPPVLAEELTAICRGREPDELVFVNARGSRILQHTFWETNWSTAVDRAQSPTHDDGSPDNNAPRLNKRPRIHDLRHTHASWLIAIGEDLPTVQRRLGHESVSTTVNIYTHLMPQQHLSAAKAAQAALDLV